MGISEKYSLKQLRVGATRLFQVLDADQSGFVDVEELAAIADQIPSGQTTCLRLRVEDVGFEGRGSRVEGRGSWSRCEGCGLRVECLGMRV